MYLVLRNLTEHKHGSEFVDTTRNNKTNIFYHTPKTV